MEKTSQQSGFYKKSTEERLNIVKEFAELTDEEAKAISGTGLPLETADKMIENVIGTMELPLGVAVNFQINGKDYLIPMAVEEPSVVAAASNMAKLVRKGGGFKCYAYDLAHTRLKERYLANGLVACDYEGGEDGSDAALKAAFADPCYPRFWPERLDAPLKRKKPAGIFVCDMGELFGDWVPEQWQWSIFNFIEACPQHRFYLLTKQPQNLERFSPFPPNCWVGVTATNAGMLDTALFWLERIEASVKYLSIEPLLPGTSQYPLYLDYERTHELRTRPLRGIDWIILGGQTNPWEPPLEEEVSSVVWAADRAGIPVHCKPNLWQSGRQSRPWPPELMRQEWPK